MKNENSVLQRTFPKRKNHNSSLMLLLQMEVSDSMKVKQSLSRVRLFATLRTVARQAPLSMGFPRQEYWSGLPFPSPGDPPDPGIEPWFPALQAESLLSQPLRKPHSMNAPPY